MSSSLHPKRYCFGPYNADTVGLELRKSGARIRLQPKPFQVLKVLLDRAGQSVSRDELKGLLWDPDTFVDFDHGLNTAVNKIREALSDSAEEPKYIETLPNGYRFIGQIDEQTAAAAPVTPPQAVSPSGTPRQPALDTSQPQLRREVQIKKYLAPAIALAGLLAAAFWAFHIPRRVFGTSAPTIRSVAVLPLKNLSGDPAQEYFSDSMTDELITQLAKISSLTVPSAASVVRYKNTEASASEISRELNVDAFVEGSVLRSGDKIRVTAQLIDGKTDRHIWAEDYEGNLRDVLVLQNEIATAIARSVRATAAGNSSKVSQPRAVDPRAYDAYIRGRLYWLRSNTANELAGDVEKSGELFRQSVQYDPSFALAYSGLADYYGVRAAAESMPAEEAWRKSEEASRKALALDEKLAEAHCSLASKLMFYDWKWAEAEREIHRSLDLDAQYALSHTLYAHLLAYTGRFDQSIAEARQAEELDPLAERYVVQRALRFSRRYDLFLAEVERVFARDPGRIHREKAFVYNAKGQHPEEVHETDEEIRLKGCVQCADRLLRAYQQGGYSGWLRQKLIQLDEASKDGNARTFEHAELYAQMGNTDMAMHYLEQGYRGHIVQLVRIQLSPAFDGMRDDARFQDLIRRIGLPQS